MPDYWKMYSVLFTAITDALSALEGQDLEKAIAILKYAQQTSEELYIRADN